eukprot:849569-Amphidinium_carterae.1
MLRKKYAPDTSSERHALPHCVQMLRSSASKVTASTALRFLLDKLSLSKRCCKRWRPCPHFT